jgi:hypothetical protein
MICNAMRSWHSFRAATRLTWAISIACALAGCGDSGPPRYQLAGSVTWKGQPVKRGYIVFTPDGAAGNSGPGAQVDIIDGRYQTSPEQGTIGGPHTAAITGFDGVPYQDGPVTNPNGKLLFSDVKQNVDLPKADGQHDFTLTQ